MKVAQTQKRHTLLLLATNLARNCCQVISLHLTFLSGKTEVITSFLHYTELYVQNAHIAYTYKDGSMPRVCSWLHCFIFAVLTLEWLISEGNEAHHWYDNDVVSATSLCFFSSSLVNRLFTLNSGTAYPQIVLLLLFKSNKTKKSLFSFC